MQPNCDKSSKIGFAIQQMYNILFIFSNCYNNFSSAFHAKVYLVIYFDMCTIFSCCYISDLKQEKNETTTIWNVIAL